ADGEDVVEPVDADALAGETIGEPLAGTVGEHLVLDPRGRVLADVPRLRWEDDRRLALAREQDVGVPMDDDESRQVRDGALEARVLGAGHDDVVDRVLVHGLSDEAVTPLDLGFASQGFHDSSSPRMSAQTALLSGVATPRQPPKRTMPPFR